MTHTPHTATTFGAASRWFVAGIVVVACLLFATSRLQEPTEPDLCGVWYATFVAHSPDGLAVNIEYIVKIEKSGRYTEWVFSGEVGESESYSYARSTIFRWQLKDGELLLFEEPKDWGRRWRYWLSWVWSDEDDTPFEGWTVLAHSKSELQMVMHRSIDGRIITFQPHAGQREEDMVWISESANQVR